MDLEVVGRHGLLFDDDSAAAFVNSGEALVEWNSLLIDRYDVRHLLSAPPPRRRTHSPPRGEAEIDIERYLDLHLPTHEQEQESDVGANSVEPGGYHSVAFSYGISVNPRDEKNHNDGMGDSGFCPPFPVPESLLQCLPPTEKVHQIIARTALFVNKNGGQSEIVLRVKQGDNPTFGFLMPDHHLHPYFRYLIDHHDLLKSDMVGKFENKDHTDKTSGALSLLGSVYGSGDDEDAAVENISESKETESRKTVDASASLIRHGSQEAGISAKVNERDAAMSKHSSCEKENIHVLKKNSLMKVSKAGIPISKKKEPHSTLPSTTVNKPSSSASVNAFTVDAVILEPPSDIKKLVDKVVEFILKNGPQCEAVLTEQDGKYGRFPFLLRSNQFNSYYVNVLRKAQESKLSGKSISEKDDQMMSRLEKKSSLDKQSESLSLGQASGDIPYDYDRKEKFKMVLGKSKKDGDEPPSTIPPSPHGYSIDAAQTAAILQAATRGIKSSHFVPNISLNGDIRNEAEAHMTKEQKQKAERLKRAKMFVSMLKNGAAPFKSGIPRALSMEPHEPVTSGKEKEDDGSINLHVETLASKDESEKKLSDSEIHERISRRKYRSKSGRNDGEEEKDESENEGEKEKSDEHFRKKRQSHRSSLENSKEVEEDEEDKDNMHDKRKKHRSHRSSREKGLEEEVDEEVRDYKHDKRKHRSRHSSHENEEEEEEESRDYRLGNRKHRYHRSSRESDIEEDEENRDYRHGKRKHRSHRSSRESDIEEAEEDKDYRHSNRKHRAHHSSRESDIEEDEKDRDYRHGKRKHRSHRSSHKDEKEEDDDEKFHKKLRKKHKSRHSSAEEDDFEERHDKHSKKKHRSHHSSRRSKDKHKDQKQDSFLRKKSPDDINQTNSSSENPRNKDLEEGEISSKSSDKSRGSMGRSANREASVDVLSSYRDGRAPSQPSEATEVPDDLRAKIRAMLMANF